MQVIIYVKKIFLYNYGHIIRCRSCRRVFQLSYTCEAVSPASKNTLLIWPLMVLTCAIQQKR